jgi:hypothetical protein
MSHFGAQVLLLQINDSFFKRLFGRQWNAPPGGTRVYLYRSRVINSDFSDVKAK